MQTTCEFPKTELSIYDFRNVQSKVFSARENTIFTQLLSESDVELYRGLFWGSKSIWNFRLGIRIPFPLASYDETDF